MKTYTAKPQSHTAAPIENRLANIYQGGESFLSDDEARATLPEISSDFNHVVILRNLPSAGFVRISACNLRPEIAKGVQWVRGGAL